MKTTIYSITDTKSDKMYIHATDVIQSGGIVVFPTETVYGIGANALNKEASKKIYQVKGRPSDNPLIVHIGKKADVYKYAKNIKQEALSLIEHFWPGPLTLILRKKVVIPDEITGGLKTVAIRMPDNEIALNLINHAQVPICAPSANISGRPSSTLFNHVVDDFFGKVDIIIDGGKSAIGLESTVLDMTLKTPTILRPGAITKEMIEQVIKCEVLDTKPLDSNLDIPKSPGMKYIHYAPKGKLTVIFGNQDNITKYFNDIVKQYDQDKVAIICALEYQDLIKCKNKVIIGSLKKPEEIAANLFIALRRMDEMMVEFIYTHSYPTDNIGYATMNRLLKAAGNNIINLE